MTTKSANKFTFDTEFRGTSDVVSDAAKARQKKTLTIEEIEALKTEAEIRGAQAAQVKAAEAIDRTIAALILSLRAALDQSRSEIEALRAEAALLAMAAAKKIAPAALAALPAGDVEMPCAKPCMRRSASRASLCAPRPK